MTDDPRRETPRAEPPPAGDRGYSPESDPMRMANQPALTRSSGKIWLIIGTLFALASLVPLVALGVTAAPVPSVTAWVAAVLVAVLLVTMFVIRFATKPGVRRLRILAGLLLGMALVALAGVWSAGALIAGVPGSGG